MRTPLILLAIGAAAQIMAAPSLYDLELAEIVRLDALADRTWQAAETPEAVSALQSKVREAAIRSIGRFPRRTPLDARQVGEEQFDGYRVEKLVFASQPGFHVPCHLYLPNDPKYRAPYPAILMPCGHNVEGKSERVHARAAVVAAQHGFAALVCDPVDEGERRQRDGERQSGIYGHRAAGLRAHLLGENLAMYRIWDGIRAIDLLAARQDIDPSRIGCAGFSGGGTMTAYLNVFDERIRSASPSAFITSIPEIARGPGPQDAEQVIFGQLTFALHHLGFLTMRAPQPILAGCSYDDFFPFAGSTNTIGKATDWYARRGLADRIDHLECPGRHGWYESEKLGLVLWMDRWLNNRPTALPFDRVALNRLNEKQQSADLDAGLGLKTDLRALCCGGNVRNLPGERTIYDLLADRAAVQAKGRAPLSPEIVREIAGIHEDRADIMRPRTVHCSFSAGKRGVVTLNLKDAVNYDRGIRKFWYKINGAAEELAVMMMWRGANLVGRRAEDILLAVREYRSSHPGKLIFIKADRRTAVAAAHAYFLARECFSGLEIADPPPSWRQILEDPSLDVYAADVVHGAYRHYDWTDFLALPMLRTL